MVQLSFAYTSQSRQQQVVAYFQLKLAIEPFMFPMVIMIPRDDPLLRRLLHGDRHDHITAYQPIPPFKYLLTFLGPLIFYLFSYNVTLFLSFIRKQSFVLLNIWWGKKDFISQSSDNHKLIGLWNMTSGFFFFLQCHYQLFTLFVL